MTAYKPSFSHALQLILDAFELPRGVEEIATTRGAGRVLAETVVAPHPYPRFDISLKDGYALDHLGPGARLTRIRTGERLPNWARHVVPAEDFPAGGSTALAALPQPIRPNAILTGAEYAESDCVARRGTLLDHRQLCQLAWFGIDRVRVFAVPLIRIALYGTEPARTAVATWLEGFWRSYYAVDVEIATVGSGADLQELSEGADLVLLVSDEVPGRYEEIKTLIHSRSSGIELAFWKLGLFPFKHVGFGQVAGTPLLILPDLFFKTVLTTIAIAPPLLAAWVDKLPFTRKATWVKLPELTYPLPCLVPLQFENEQRELKVLATPLRSSFSARYACRAEGCVILNAPPALDQEFDATVLGRLTDPTLLETN